MLAFGIIMSMYGGGFATIPSYLADIFGTKFVGAIHGRLLTAWAVAGVLGPVLVNYIRQFQIDAGVAPANAYNITMFIMAGLLVIGFICNLLVKPVDSKFHMDEDEAGEGAPKKKESKESSSSSRAPGRAAGSEA